MAQLLTVKDLDLTLNTKTCESNLNHKRPPFELNLKKSWSKLKKKSMFVQTLILKCGPMMLFETIFSNPKIFPHVIDHFSKNSPPFNLKSNINSKQQLKEFESHLMFLSKKQEYVFTKKIVKKNIIIVIPNLLNSSVSQL
jgi:hypothetical protein